MVDIAAIEYLFPPIGARATKEDPYIRLGRYFLPTKAVEDVSAYQGWDAQGLLDGDALTALDAKDDAAWRAAAGLVRANATPPPRFES